MAYIVEQKIGKHVYVYEVQSYWDSEKKQPRQKRKYIGKKDLNTGKVITPRKSNLPRLSKDFGHVYLLEGVAKEIGLKGALEDVFGEGEAQEILNLAFYSISEGRPLYLYKHWAEITAVTEGSGTMSSQKISRLLKELGKEEVLREMFIGKWIEQQEDIKAVVFDITSFSSYSRGLELLEWGYNRDGDALRQVNFGVIMGSPSALPIGYRIYPGSITDVVTLKNLVGYLEGKGLRQYMFVLDRGFYSERNISMMGKEGVDFIIPMPFSSGVARSLLSRHLKDLDSAVNAFMYEGEAFFHVQGEIEIGGKGVTFHIYSNEKRKAEGMERLIRRLAEIEDAVAVRRFRAREEVEEFIEGQFRGGSRFYSIEVSAEGVELLRRQKALSRRINIMGKMILLCSVFGMDRVEVLSLYRRKDFIEKVFEVMKNEIDDGRLRIRRIDSLEGRLFLMFIALILYIALSNKMREEELYKKYTLSEVLYELKKLRLVEMLNGKKYLTEITKKQRTLYEKFGIPLPVIT
ncbi:MAG: IS1634 family transposase [Nitrospirae bacterium]|nr:IS1634 family transposase [Nitrospirota bacterium]